MGRSGCGAAQSAMGPFYCPSDNGIYIDTDFYRELDQRLGAGGDFARAYRNYGKPDYQVHGLGYRMSEFTAALGLVQLERLDEIVAWKNDVARRLLDPLFPSRLQFPDGMTSGHYKYLVFEPIKGSTGRVYDEPTHRILGSDRELPNSDWVAANHSCVPLYYRGPERPANPEPWARLKEEG